MLFISPYKFFSFSRYLIFCLDILVIYRNGLIRKIRLFSKFMTSQPRKETIAIHILPNILRSKVKPTMTFGQLIERNIRNVFFEKTYTKRSAETISCPFSKKSKLGLGIPLDQ